MNAQYVTGGNEMLRMSIVGVMLLAAAATGPAWAQTSSSHAKAASAHATTPAGQTLAADQFSTEQAAKAHCPGDTIVWANTSGSKAFHMSSDRYYGKTKHGAYMCEKEAEQGGFHAAGARARKTATKTAK